MSNKQSQRGVHQDVQNQPNNVLICDGCGHKMNASYARRDGKVYCCRNCYEGKLK